MNSKEIQAIHYVPQNSFYVAVGNYETTPGSVTDAVLRNTIGGAFYATISGESEKAGNRIVNENGIHDPVFIFKERFLKLLSKNLKLTNFGSIPDAFSDDALTELDGAFHNGLVLDFRTLNWGIGDFSNFNTASTSIKYEGRVRLLAFPEAKILWQGTCPTPKMADGNMDELLENHANRLKEKFAYLAKQCASALTRQFDRKM